MGYLRLHRLSGRTGRGEERFDRGRKPRTLRPLQQELVGAIPALLPVGRVDCLSAHPPLVIHPILRRERSVAKDTARASWLGEPSGAGAPLSARPTQGQSTRPDDAELVICDQTIDVHYNRLPKSERQRLIQAFPEARIDLRNQDTEETESGQDDLRAVVELIKKGKGSLTYPYTEALQYFDEALTYFSRGLTTNEYNLIYIHYIKMWIYAQLQYHSLDTAPADIPRYEELGREEAQTCLDLVPENLRVWHFTEEAQFHKEVIRFACNYLAWSIYQRYDDAAHLETALQLAERGAEFATEPQYYSILDTQVRILYKLNRVQEADTIVQLVLREVPDFPDFQDFRTHQPS